MAHHPNADTQSVQPKPQTPPAATARSPELQADAHDCAIRLLQRLSAEQSNTKETRG